MAEIVKQVPCPWKKYMDGNIWRLSTEEISTIPGYRPTSNYADHDICGMTMVQWYVEGWHYVRFYHREDVNDKWWLERLAGWVD